METNTSSPFEQAVGAEVRALAGRKNLSHKEIQQAAGVEQRSFRRYFVECNRAIPVDVVQRVAAALGVSTSDIFRAAEQAMADADPLPPGAFTKGDLDLAADKADDEG